MLRDSKVIVTCAVTGAAPFNPKHPSFPVTPKEIADATSEAAKAGAAIAHIHVRDPDTKLGVLRSDLFKEVVDRIRDDGADILINLTGGGGATFFPSEEDEAMAAPGSHVASLDERMEHIELCRPDIASLDINTSNQVEGEAEFVYLNSTRTLRAMADRFRAANVKPELEVFSAGDIEFGKALQAEGRLVGRPMYQFVLGVKWQAPASTFGMEYFKGLLPDDAVWGALGIGREQMPVAAQTAIMGGNVRVGLEDNLYLRKGEFATNGDLVTRAVELIGHLGYEVASTAEARNILGVD
ncbi:MAG: 3-keto-5-aminohexanoate cleavage protein [Pseudomonadota bacterium]